MSVLGHVLNHVPEYVPKHVPEYMNFVLRHMPDKHVLEHVLKRMAHTFPMTLTHLMLFHYKSNYKFGTDSKNKQ